MSEREGPETKVRRRVGNAAEHELNGFNNLMDEDFTEVVMTFSLGSMKTQHGLDIIDGALTAISIKQLLLFVLVLRLHIMELVLVFIVLLATTADGDAGDTAEHEREHDARNVDENIGNLLLTAPVLIVVRVGRSKASDAHDVTNDNDDDGGHS